MITHEIEDKLKGQLGDSIIAIKVPRERRIFLRIKTDSFRKVIEYIFNVLEFKHLSTITGVDMGNDIELLYHLTYKGAVVLSLGISIPKSEPHIQTVSDLLPTALFYEREVHDFFGVIFDGHPDLSLLLLPEGWPKDVYPLRKDCSVEAIKEILSKNWG